MGFWEFIAVLGLGITIGTVLGFIAGFIVTAWYYGKKFTSGLKESVAKRLAQEKQKREKGQVDEVQKLVQGAERRDEIAKEMLLVSERGEFPGSAAGIVERWGMVGLDVAKQLSERFGGNNTNYDA